MTLASVAACFLPAWRATRTDPIRRYARNDFLTLLRQNENDLIFLASRFTGKPEVIDSSVGLVPTNALVVIKGANSRIVGNPEVIVGANRYVWSWIGPDKSSSRNVAPTGPPAIREAGLSGGEAFGKQLFSVHMKTSEGLGWNRSVAGSAFGMLASLTDEAGERFFGDFVRRQSSSPAERHFCLRRPPCEP
jgi:hypothetical protein